MDAVHYLGGTHSHTYTHTYARGISENPHKNEQQQIVNK